MRYSDDGRMSVASARMSAPLMAVTDPARLRDLRRMKAFATGLLVLAAVVYLVARANEDDGAAWVGYVRAFAEAAMVGALADWFAVTALFRYPLGLPIPHTAIIPKRKDQIGRSLGEFVEGNFLTREVLAERLEGVHAGHRLGQWLAVPDHAARASGFAGDAAKGVIEVLDDRDVQSRARRHGRAAAAPGRRRPAAGEGRRRLGRGRPPPAAARRRAHGRVDVPRREPGHAARPAAAGVAVVGARARSTTASSRRSSTACSTSSPTSPATPTTRCAGRIEERVLALAERLRDDPVMIAKVTELRDELLSHPEVQAWLESLWGSVKSSVLDAAGDPTSELRLRLTSGLQTLGTRLVADVELQEKIDDWLERTAGLRRRQLQERGRRPHRHDRRALGQPGHVAPHRAAGRPRPPVHPHQRHRRRRHRRPPHPHVGQCCSERVRSLEDSARSRAAAGAARPPAERST